MDFKNRIKNIEKRIKTIKNNKTKMKRIFTRKILLPQDEFNLSDKKLMKNFIHPRIIKDRIDNLQSKRQTTIGKNKNVKRITNLNIEQQKQKLIKKYNELATIQKDIGEKKSSRRKKKKINRKTYKKPKRGGRGKSRRRRKQKKRRTKRR